MTLTNVSLTDAGMYNVLVTNLAGSVNSQYGVLRVWTPSGVVGWGDNSEGQLNIPANLTNAVAVSAGMYQGLVLRSDNTLAAWGNNFFGQASVPAGLTNVLAISAGEYEDLVLKADGTVFAWGINYGGQTNIPPGLGNVVAVAAGENFNLALKSDGTVVAWGSPTNVPSGLANVVTIAAGEAFSLALKGDGTVAAWGDNTYGQTNVPSGLANVIAVSAGEYHSLALLGNGTVVAWGNNASGQTNVPPGLTNVVAIAAGLNHSLALLGNGTVVAWGNNASGQTNVPAGLTNVVAIAGGGAQSLALGYLPAVNVPPIITQQPLNVTTNIGGSASFTVTVSTNSTLPLHYQWYFNGTNVLVGSTNSVLTVTNVQSSQAGTYSVIITNVAGSVTSSNAVLTVLQSIVMAVYITQPSSNAVFVAPGVVAISANVVSNMYAVSQVNFYADGTLIGSDLTDLSNPYKFTWIGASAGSHLLTAQAVDAQGNTANSVGLPIYVETPISVNAGTNQVVILTGSSVNVTLNGSYAGGDGAVTSLDHGQRSGRGGLCQRCGHQHHRHVYECDGQLPVESCRRGWLFAGGGDGHDYRVKQPAAIGGCRAQPHYCPQQHRLFERFSERGGPAIIVFVVELVECDQRAGD